jgi:hypothetical protein
MIMKEKFDQFNELLYYESVTSKRTDELFKAFTFISYLLLIWRVTNGRLDMLDIVFFCLFLFFLFYTLNYKTLIISLRPESLKLKFGIFTWAVPIDNIGDYHIDEIPVLLRMGGAGIHFMVVGKRYRASFNFLEHPRVVIELKSKVLLVQDISFSTRRPDDVLSAIQSAVSLNKAA